MKLMTFSVGGKASWGAATDAGDLGKRMGREFPGLKALIAGDGFAAARKQLEGAATDRKLAGVGVLRTPIRNEK